jgi:hypothetical protein
LGCQQTLTPEQANESHFVFWQPDRHSGVGRHWQIPGRFDHAHDYRLNTPEKGNSMTRNTALGWLGLLALLATMLTITVVPGSSILDLNIDVGTKVFAFYVAYMVWALLTVLLGSAFFTLWGTRQQAKA